MGKKRIIKKTEEEVLKESDNIQGAVKKVAGKSKGGTINRVGIYIQATYNNIIITAANERGDVIASSSSGALGFKGAKKATPFASSKVAEAVNEKLSRFNFSAVDIYVKGVGSGRDSAIRFFANRGFDILSIKDITPIPHNGCRPRKPRRV